MQDHRPDYAERARAGKTDKSGKGSFGDMNVLLTCHSKKLIQRVVEGAAEQRVLEHKKLEFP